MENISFDTMTDTSGTPEPVVKQGGSTEISDDEVATLSGDETTPKEKAKKELAGKVDKKERQEKDDKSEAKTATKEVEAEQQALKVKTLKLKNGDSDVEINEDAIVPVKVNGELVNVPVKDLLANYSGKTDWTRKYQDLHNEKTEFYTERDTINGRINEFYRLAVDEKNPRIAIDFLAESMGADPQEVWANLMNPVKEAYKNAPNLSPEEIAAKEKDEELNYYKRREELRKSESQKATEKQGLTKRIEETQTKYGMAPEQFKQAYQDLVQEAKRLNFDVNELTPEMVGEFYAVSDRQSKVTAFVAETWKDSEKAPEIEKQLYDTWKRNPEFSMDDLKDIAIEVFGAPKSKASKIAEKVKTTTNKRVMPQHEPLTWDEL